MLPDGLSGVMVSMLALSVEGCWFNPLPGQTKDIKICFWCFSAKQAALRSKDWLAQSSNNVSVLSGISS